MEAAERRAGGHPTQGEPLRECPFLRFHGKEIELLELITFLKHVRLVETRRGVGGGGVLNVRFPEKPLLSLVLKRVYVCFLLHSQHS